MDESPAEDELLKACLAAPRHGLNAKTLILQAALAAGDDSDDEGAGSPAKRQRMDPAAEAAAAAARRGAEFLAAVPAQQRPLVPYLARSKIPRIHRQTVLSKLAGEHLSLAAHRRQPPLEPSAAAADAPLRQDAWEAALAQERELFERCSSTVVYRNLAARTSATQWQPIQQQGQQQATLASPARQDAPAMQQGQQTESATAGQQDEPPPGQQAPDERQLNGQASAAADRPKAAPSATQLQLEEADIDWEAALPESLADKLGTSAADPGDEGGSPPQRGPTTACTAAITGRTELGAGEFAPLSAAPPGGAARKTATAGPLGEGSAATDSALAAGAAADVQPAQRVSNGAAAQTAAGDDKPAAVAAPDLVRQQVELFVRAELHPLLRRGQISQGLHDAVAAKSAAKVMQRHSGAGSADFLVTEAAAIRSLVQQYLKHLRQQQQQQQPT